MKRIIIVITVGVILSASIATRWGLQAARLRSVRSCHCSGNIIFIGHQKAVYAIKHSLTTGDVVTEKELEDFVGADTWESVCSDGGTYIIGPIGTDVMCSIHGDSHH